MAIKKSKKNTLAPKSRAFVVRQQDVFIWFIVFVFIISFFMVSNKFHFIGNYSAIIQTLNLLFRKQRHKDTEKIYLSLKKGKTLCFCASVF